MVNADTFDMVREAGSYVEAFLVVMSQEDTSNHMLITLVQCSESVQPVFARVLKEQLMADYDGLPTYRLQLLQLALQPLHLLAWVIL